MKKIVVAVVASCCVALTGCGSDSKDSSDDKPSAASEASVREALIEQGDAICAKGTPAIEAIGNDFADPENPTAAELEGAVAKLTSEIEDQVAQLRELEVPEEDTDLITAMLGSLEVALSDLAEEPQLLVTGDVFSDANRIAKDYGFKECGKG